jgi:GNAT superfamily N-acetyltransferase
MGEASYGPAIHGTVPEEGYEKAEGEYVTTILSASKLHMVAVDPGHRGRRHGRRLVNSAVDRLVKGGTVMIYGQFTGDRDLRRYYSSLGFDVLGKGEPLNMALATGKDFWLTPQPDDTMFVRHFPPRLPPKR